MTPTDEAGVTVAPSTTVVVEESKSSQDQDNLMSGGAKERVSLVAAAAAGRARVGGRHAVRRPLRQPRAPDPWNTACAVQRATVPSAPLVRLWSPPRCLSSRPAGEEAP